MKPARQPVKALRHLAETSGPAVSIEVVLPAPPVPTVPLLDSIVGGWWYRAGGYPVGRDFGRMMY